MRKLCPATFAMVVGTMIGSLAQAHQIGLLGNAPDGTIYDVDISTGQVSNPRPTGINFLVDLADYGNGIVYGLTTFASTPENSLVRIHPTTGQWSLVGPAGVGDLFEGDLAIDSTTGRLLGIQHFDFDTEFFHLFEIDRATGAATLTGNVVGADDLSAMAFDDSGTLYIIDTGLSQLLTIDPDTADVLDSVTISTSLGTGAGMAFEPTTGTLYVADGGAGGTEKLYTLDPALGLMTEVGPLNLPNGLLGLTFFLSSLFHDDFETGDTTAWSGSVP